MADAALLAELGATTFRQSHGHSLEVADINEFISRNHTTAAVTAQLSDENNLFHIARFHGAPAAYSKLVLHSPHPGSIDSTQCKLDRIYVLEQFIPQKIGEPLIRFNFELANKKGQKAIWLYVWKENPRAVRFYTKMGFSAIGSHDFRISETRVNPNHIMYREL